MASIRLDKKNKTIKIVNRRDTISLKHTGKIGPQGPIGATGPQGNAGVAGGIGATGTVGLDGQTGATGPAGSTGATGPKGDSGDPGGATGATGSIGATGVGTQGPTGATGPLGLQGYTGAAGINGATGAAGTNGATGATGPQGSTGPAGTNGADSTVAGATGATGPVGATGASGGGGSSAGAWEFVSSTDPTVATDGYMIDFAVDFTTAQRYRIDFEFAFDSNNLGKPQIQFNREDPVNGQATGFKTTGLWTDYTTSTANGFATSSTAAMYLALAGQVDAQNMFAGTLDFIGLPNDMVQCKANITWYTANTNHYGSATINSFFVNTNNIPITEISLITDANNGYSSTGQLWLYKVASV